MTKAGGFGINRIYLRWNISERRRNTTEESEKIQKAKESFEAILLNDKYSDIIGDDEHRSLLLEMLPFKIGDTILDVGTGAGYLAFPIAQANPDCEVIGLDIADRVIQQNQVRQEKEQIDNLRFCSFDGKTYPFNANSMNVILSRYAFHHFPNVAMTVKQWMEMLCEDGKILISDPIRNERDERRIIDQFMEIKGDGHIGFYTKQELLNLFAEYGMRQWQMEITVMSFPFPKKQEYLDLFDTLCEEEKAMYEITERDGVIWVGRIEVANLLLGK